ncbi:MAG: Sapep family Mn(2+)-dependent dipeptidase [Christensenellales bacterium]
MNNPDLLLHSKHSDMIDALQRLLRIDSTKQPAQADAPFGPGIRQALEQMLEEAATLSLPCVNVDNYAGFVEIGSGEETVGVLVHLDVVPPGLGWTFPPFGGTIQDGKIVGRGAMDNKGPAIAALFALWAVCNSGASLTRKIRLIFGCDEESGWADIDYYKQKYPMPDFGFSPDAQYPIINGEKSILHLELSKKFVPAEGPRILSLQSGNAVNMVPDHACCVLADGSLAEGDTYLIKDDAVELHTYGVSAHGSTPWQGKNAVFPLLSMLEGLKLCGDGADFASLLYRWFYNDFYGESLGIDCSDDATGRLSVNLGRLSLDESGATAGVDIRHPLSVPKEQILQQLEAMMAPFGIQIRVLNSLTGLYIPPNDELIVALSKAYEEKNHQRSHCISIGGATYARSLKKGVAFGPLMPGQTDCAHRSNESYSLDRLLIDAQTIAAALIILAS